MARSAPLRWLVVAALAVVAGACAPERADPAPPGRDIDDPLAEVMLDEPPLIVDSCRPGAPGPSDGGESRFCEVHLLRAELVNSSWCSGICGVTLSLDGSEIVATVRDSADAISTSIGWLTENGERRLDALEEALVTFPVADWYGGQPFVTDLPGYFLELRSGSVITETGYIPSIAPEFSGVPNDGEVVPEEIGELGEFAWSLIEALAACSESEAIDIADECMAVEL